jgi:hypothetical protein
MPLRSFGSLFHDKATDGGLIGSIPLVDQEPMVGPVLGRHLLKNSFP